MNYSVENIGDKPAMAATRRLIVKMAKCWTRTVLIYGEIGTGKGLVAGKLHSQNSGANSNFVDVKCAAIPANMAESALFGYKKGAFTGMLAKKNGMEEAANGGSLFSMKFALLIRHCRQSF